MRNPKDNAAAPSRTTMRIPAVCTNSLGGAPMQSPSDVLPIRFQAGLRIQAIQNLTNRVTVSFRGPPGISNLLEAADSTTSGNWQPAASS
jgi:hypothetical protein